MAGKLDVGQEHGFHSRACIFVPARVRKGAMCLVPERGANARSKENEQVSQMAMLLPQPKGAV